MLSIKSLLLGVFLAGVFVLMLYIKQGMPPLSGEILAALWDLFSFGFAFSWSLALLLFLFREMRGIFLHCHAGYRLELLSCKGDQVLENIGYGDLLKVWRRWFMLLIWLVGSIILLAVALRALISPDESFSEWFSIFWLSFFILLGGYFSFILLGSRCKKVRIARC